MVNNPKQTVHVHPRISLNKLGEYLITAKASRRERILKDAKYPPTFQVIRYDPTQFLIQRFLGGKITLAELKQEIADYAASPAEEDFEKRMKKSNVDAMGRFFEMAKEGIQLGDAKIVAGTNTPHRRTINGVSVSVRPELRLSVIGNNKPTKHGGIKLNISKGAVHGKDAAEYVGAVLRHYIADDVGDEGCDHELCFTLDVFGQKLSASPKATTNRMKDIEAACGEIARQWPSI